MKAMLLAAGKGKRMQPLTAQCPKPLLRAGGKRLIEYHLEKLATAGIREVVINHAWLGEQFEPALGNGDRWGLRIRWSPEGEPLETAGGIRRALPLLGKAPFLVISSDIWTDFDFAELVELDPGDDLAHLVMVPNAPHHPTGDFVLSGDRLTLGEGGSGMDTCTYSGIGVYRPAMFSALPGGFAALRPLLESAISEQRLSGRLYRGQWSDIGSPQRLSLLDQQLSGTAR